MRQSRDVRSGSMGDVIQSLRNVCCSTDSGHFSVLRKEKVFTGEYLNTQPCLELVYNMRNG
jgi:hypothetical protein